MAYITRHGNNAPTIFDIFNRPLSDFDFSGNNQAPERESGFAVDVRDLGNCYVLEADLPGCTKADINLQFEDGVLTIMQEQKGRRNRMTEPISFVNVRRGSTVVASVFRMPMPSK